VVIAGPAFTDFVTMVRTSHHRMRGHR
jgi:hypothetical protein